MAEEKKPKSVSELEDKIKLEDETFKAAMAALPATIDIGGRPTNPVECLKFNNVLNNQRKKVPIEEYYLDELARLEEELPEFVEVPIGLAKQIGYALVRPDVFIDNPWPQIWTLSLREARSDIKRANLIKYLSEGSQGPCYCGSGWKYEKCHAREDLPVLRKTILLINRGRE